MMTNTRPKRASRPGWRRAITLVLSAALGAAAGCSDAPRTAAPQLRLNEVVARTSDGSEDWFELVNTGEQPVGLEGLVVTDDDPSHRLELQTLGRDAVAPGEHLVVRLPAALGWGLGTSDCLRLLDASDQLLEETCWGGGGAEDGRSWGRLPDGDGDWQVLGPTPGSENAALASCGNGTLDASEVCDIADTAALSCASLLFKSGDMVCDACASIDVTTCATHLDPIQISELSASEDWIELVNTGAEPIALQGYLLSDRVELRVREVAVEPVTLAPGAFHVVQLTADSAFRLGAEEVVIMRDPTDRVVDMVGWAAGQAEPSLCRPQQARVVWPTCSAATPGASNLP